MSFLTRIDAALPLPRRPSSLISAAMAGQAGWKRQYHLPRLLRRENCPAPGAALARLMTEEEAQNDARLARIPGYDMQRHVLLMIAILAEQAMVGPQPVTSAANPKHP